MTLKAWAVLFAIILGSFVIEGVVVYTVGKHAGSADARRQIRADSLQHVREALRANARIVDSTRRVVTAEVRKDSVVRRRRTDARAVVHITSDTSVIIGSDSAGPTVVVPPAIVALIAADDSMMVQDSIALRAESAVVAGLMVRDSLHTTVEHLQDETIADLSPQRCGMRCGFVAGATGVLAATHPAQLVKAARWIWSLVHP